MTRLWELLTAQKPPHGYCLLWEPALVWTHVISDALIAAAYFSIPIALIKLVRARPDIRFSWIFWLFATFIASCGTTHLMMIWNLYNGDYGAEAVVKAVSAIASVGTAIALWPLIPRLISLPSASSLHDLNRRLAGKVAELDDTLVSLRYETGEKERAQQTLVQAQKMEAVGQLTGGIAHDFNNLLMVISGNLEMLSKKPDDPRKERWITHTLEATNRAAKLTAQLLAFSRVQKLHLRETELKPLLINLKEMIARTIGSDATIKLGHIDDLVVTVDPTQLELAILNLALNARDASPDHGLVEISTTIVNGHVEVLVTDNGRGIPEEIRDRIFEPFFTTKDVGKGTGLGLPMVYGVAKQFSGSVYLKNTSSKGTTIALSLPITMAPELPELIDVDEPASEPRPRKVLVIDDEEGVRDIISDMLESLGCSVRVAEDGPEALVMLKSEKPDVILLDYAMPVMSGATVKQAIKRVYPDVPIVFITGYAVSDELGDSVVLKKPIVTADLKRALNAVELPRVMV